MKGLSPHAKRKKRKILTSQGALGLDSLLID